MSIRELIEAVEAGHTPEAHEITSALRPLYDGEEPIVAYVRMACDAADLRAVGAALALMQALLPRKRVQTIYEADDGSWLAILVDRETNYNAVRAAAGSLARALLLAILKAKEGETP